MEKNTLTFDNTGFVYDLENPTQQTEELSFILKNALLLTTPINIRQETDQEWDDRLNREQDVADCVEGIQANIDGLHNTIINMGGEGNTLYNWLQIRLSDIATLLSSLQVLTDYLMGVEEDSDDLLSAINTVAASSGIFLDAPGLSIIDKPELL